MVAVRKYRIPTVDIGKAIEKLMTVDADYVRRVIRQRMRDYGGTQKDWAEYNGFTPSYITMVLNNKKDPSSKLCDIVGVIKTIAYVKEDE